MTLTGRWTSIAKSVGGGVLVLHGGGALAGANCQPGIAGPTVNWALIVCQGRHSTDDSLHPDVAQCQKELVGRDRIPAVPKEDCHLNLKYKTEFCRYRVQADRDRSVAACVASVESIPRAVSHGIGG